MRREYNSQNGRMTVTQYIASKGYTTCEWIKSDGKCFMTVNHSGAFRMECEAMSPSSNVEYCIIGAHGLSSPYGRNFISFSYGANRRSQFQCGICGYTSYGSFVANQKYHIEFQSLITNNYLKVDGQTLRQSTSRIVTSDGGTSLCNLANLYLWTEHYSVRNANTWSKHRLYWLKVWDPSNDQLIARLYPCYKNSQIGLYDIVTDTFKSNENNTGSFSKGSDYNFTEEL